MYVFVSEDHMLDWHSCQTCYPLEKSYYSIIIILCKTQTGLRSHREASLRLVISDIETRDIIQQ